MKPIEQSLKDEIQEVIENHEEKENADTLHRIRQIEKRLTRLEKHVYSQAQQPQTSQQPETQPEKKDETQEETETTEETEEETSKQTEEYLKGFAESLSKGRITLLQQLDTETYTNAEELSEKLGIKKPAIYNKFYKINGNLYQSDTGKNGEGYRLTETGSKVLSYIKEDEEVQEEKEINKLKEGLTRKRKETLKELSQNEAVDGKELSERLDVDLTTIYNRFYEIDDKLFDRTKVGRKTAYSLTETGAKVVEKIRKEEEEEAEDTLVESSASEDVDTYADYDVYEFKRSKRIEKIKEMMKELNKPLSRGEIAKEFYGLKEHPENATRPYNAIATSVQKMEKDGEIEKVERLNSGRNTYYILSEQAEEFSEEEKESGLAGLEPDEKIHAILAERNGYPTSKKMIENEAELLKQALSKLYYGDELEEVTYHEFEKRYGGNLRAMDAWSYLFQKPELTRAILDAVEVEKDVSWEKRGNNGTPEEWVLTLL